MDADLVRQVLNYDAATGIFTWRVKPHRGILAGTVAGSKHREGYWAIGYQGRAYLAHRLAWLYVYGVWPADQIDHKDRERLNNRIGNLREATTMQNKQNLAPSDTRGTSYSKRPRTKRWQAKIHVGDKDIYLGRFDTQADANAAYVAAKRKFHPYGTI